MSFAGLFSVGLSGVNAFTASLETISSNIANSQTDGFKRAEVDFSTLLGSNDPRASNAVGNARVGAGVVANGLTFASQQGTIARTDNPGDLAIAGDGFLIVSDPQTTGAADDPILFTRAGGFRPNADGLLVNPAGLILQGIPVGANATATVTQSLAGLENVNINRAPPNGASGDVVSFDIDGEGFLSAQYTDGSSERLYRLPLARFRNDNGLERVSDTAFANTQQSGEALLRAPGDRGAGQLVARAREQSTVEIGEEFGRLIETQRAYATNARLISIADELWQRTIDTAA